MTISPRPKVVGGSPAGVPIVGSTPNTLLTEKFNLKGVGVGSGDEERINVGFSHVQMLAKGLGKEISLTGGSIERARIHLRRGTLTPIDEAIILLDDHLDLERRAKIMSGELVIVGNPDGKGGIHNLVTNGVGR